MSRRKLTIERQWRYRKGGPGSFPTVKFPPGFFQTRELVINEPMGLSMDELEQIARLITKAPALLMLADKLARGAENDEALSRWCAETVNFIRGDRL